jgi:hypothetical protein
MPNSHPTALDRSPSGVSALHCLQRKTLLTGDVKLEVGNFIREFPGSSSRDVFVELSFSYRGSHDAGEERDLMLVRGISLAELTDLNRRINDVETHQMIADPTTRSKVKKTIFTRVEADLLPGIRYGLEVSPTPNAEARPFLELPSRRGPFYLKELLGPQLRNIASDLNTSSTI